MYGKKTLYVGLILLILGAAAQASAQASAEVQEALDWLRGQQSQDGGFSNGMSEGSDLGATADAVFALVSAGEDPGGWRVGDATPVSFIQGAVSGGGLSGPGVAAKVSMAVQLAGLDPRDFAGRDLLAEIREGYDQGSGLFGGGPFDSALAILALRAAGESEPDQAIEALLGTRLEEGSYSFNGDTTPGAGDTNTTGLVVQALVAAGQTDQVSPSLDYLRSVQNEDGGWPYQVPSDFGTDTDANSTALVIQALLAAGEDLQDWGNPLQSLRDLQGQSGAFGYSASFSDPNILATLQAIPALAGVDYVDVPDLAVSAGGSPEGFDAWAVVGAVALVLVLMGAWVVSRLSADRGRQ